MKAKTARTIKQIVNVFETGKAKGDYSAAALLPDGAGISYGRSQATDGGGNLDRIVYRYLDLGGELGEELRPYLDELVDNATTRVDVRNPPAWVKELMELLAKAGEDPIMRKAQDAIFDEEYWEPAVNQAKAMQLELPLSWAVVYDTCIHSGPGGVARIRRRFPEVPPSRGGDEMAWTRAYIRARYAWLSGYPNPLVRKTVYRMKTFLQLIEADNWHLERPLRVLGATIR